MRACLIILAAALSLVGFVVTSAASTGGGSSVGGSTSSGGSSSSSGGGAGGGHGGGGGGGHGGGSSGGGGHLGGGLGSAGYAAHGGYVAHGAHGGYGIVGNKSAGLGHDEAASQSGHSARNTLAIGPRTGGAAKAMRVTYSHTAPPKPPKYIPHHHFHRHETPEMPSPFCIPVGPLEPQQDRDVFNCPRPIKTVTDH